MMFDLHLPVINVSARSSVSVVDGIAIEPTPSHESYRDLEGFTALVRDPRARDVRADLEAELTRLQKRYADQPYTG